MAGLTMSWALSGYATSIDRQRLDYLERIGSSSLMGIVVMLR
jgi:hypothetical protein